jgi:hypothetical protein
MFTGEIQRARSTMSLVLAPALVAKIEGTAKLKALVQESVNQTLREGLVLERGARKKLRFDEDAKDGQATVEFDDAKGDVAPGLGRTAEVAGDDTNLFRSVLGK